MWRVICGDNRQIRILYATLNGLLLVTILASISLNHYHSQQEMEQTARTEAKTLVERDLLFHRWFSDSGGLYAPVSADIPANRHLTQVPDRDLIKPDGTLLTLVDGTYLLQLVNNRNSGNSLPLTRMISRQPLYPGNNPDVWESAALRLAEQQGKEVSEFTTINGRPYLRLLHPLRTEASCLKCHAAQGHRLGDDPSGGLAMALPMGELQALHDTTMRFFYLNHLLLYLLGVVLLFWGQCFVARRIRERDLAQAALEASEANFRTVANFAYAWEYWVGPDGQMKYVSPSVRELTGYEPERFLADPDFIKTIIVDKDQELFRDHVALEQLEHADCSGDFRIRTATGEILWLHHVCRPVYGRDGDFLGRRASNFDISVERTALLRNEELIAKLREALDKVKTLSGFLPICASCKKIRDDQGYWNQIESYISSHSEAVFSHGICPDCAHRLYPEFYPPGNKDGEDSGPGKPAEK